MLRNGKIIENLLTSYYRLTVAGGDIDMEESQKILLPRSGIGRDVRKSFIIFLKWKRENPKCGGRHCVKEKRVLRGSIEESVRFFAGWTVNN
jgi:hypothetical protein